MLYRNKQKRVLPVLRVSAFFVAMIFIFQMAVREPRAIMALASEQTAMAGALQDADETGNGSGEDEPIFVIPGEVGEPTAEDGTPIVSDKPTSPNSAEGSEEPVIPPPDSPDEEDETAGQENAPAEDSYADPLKAVTPNAVIPDITRKFFFTAPIKSFAESVKTVDVTLHQKLTFTDIFSGAGLTGASGTELTSSHVTKVTLNGEESATYLSVVKNGEQFDYIEIVKDFDQPQIVSIEYKDPDNGETVTLQVQLRDSLYMTDLNKLVKEEVLHIGDETFDGTSDVTVLYNPKKLYTLEVSFAETPLKQFANYETLIYKLPTGFVLPDNFDETNQMIEIYLGSSNGYLSGNTVRTGDEDGTVKIQWNRDDAQHFEYFTHSTNAKFTLVLKGTLDPGGGKFIFSTGKELEMIEEEPDNAIVQKEITADLSSQGSHKVSYRVSVYSEGATQNLTLKDVMGQALISPEVENISCYFQSHKHMTATGSGEEGDAVQYIFDEAYRPTITSSPGNGFQVSIPKMEDDDKLIFEYDCQVDINQIAKSGSPTFDETGNTASVSGDLHPEDNEATAWVQHVTFSDIEKSVKGVRNLVEDNQSKVEITWQVVTNKAADVRLAGSVLTDTMGKMTKVAENSTSTRSPLGLYSGDGIHIEMTNALGVTTTRDVSWESMGVNTSKAKTWTYQIPEDDEPAKYVVTYTTKINSEDLTGGQWSVPNTISGKCGEDSAVALVSPPGQGGISVSKQAVNIASESVTWEVNMDISNDCLDLPLKLSEMQSDDGNFKDKDKYALPRVNFPNDGVYDSNGKKLSGLTFQEKLQSITIEGLQPGESVKAYYFIANSISGKDSDAEANGSRKCYTATMGSGDTMTITIDAKDNEANNTNRRFYMYFYKDEDCTLTGLKEPVDGGEKRRITVRLNTTFPAEWAQSAKEYSDYSHFYKPYLFTHRNWVTLSSVAATDSFNTQPIGIYKNAYNNNARPQRNPVKSEVMYQSDGVTPVKDSDGQPVTIDVTYPMYQFTIAVNGISTNEPIVIYDYFDTSLFRLFNWTEYIGKGKVRTEGGSDDLTKYRPYFAGQRDIHSWGINQSVGTTRQVPVDSGRIDENDRLMVDDNTYGVHVRETDFGAIFTFDDPSKFKDNSGQYSNFYVVDYMMMPRDAAALAKLEKMALDGDKTGAFKNTAVFTNTAVCRSVSTSAIATYTAKNDLKPVQKYYRVVDEFDSNGKPKQHPRINFTIDVNPGKLEMNKGRAMDVVDKYSDSLSIDYQSVTIATDPPDALVTYDFRKKDNVNQGVFTIPDNTRVMINYSACIIAPPDVAEGQTAGEVNFSNSVEVVGYGADVSNHVTVSAKSTGEAITPKLYLFKFSDSHMENGLNGAKFAMYEEYDPEHFKVVGETRYRIYIDSDLVVRDDIIYVKDPDGTERKWDNPKAKVIDGKVYLEYPMCDTVTIPDKNGTPKQYIPVMNGNHPLETVTGDKDGKSGYAELKLTQSEAGRNLDFDRYYYLMETEAPDGYSKSDILYKFQIKADGTVDYSNYHYLSDDVLTVRNTPSMIKLNLTKQFKGNLKLSEEAKAQLRFKLEKLNTATEPETWEVCAGYENVAFNQFRKDADDTYDYQFKGLLAGQYRLTEMGNSDIVHAYAAQTEPISVKTHTQYLWDDNEGNNNETNGDTVTTFTVTQDQIVSGEPRSVVFSNSYNTEVVNKTVYKKWVDQNGAAMNWPRKLNGSNVEVQLSVYEWNDIQHQPVGNAVRTVTLDGVADSNGETQPGVAVFKDLPKYHLMAETEEMPEIQYVVKEENVLDGYDSNAVSALQLNDVTATVTNTKKKAEPVTFTKSWTPAPPSGTTAGFKLYACPVEDGKENTSRSEVIESFELDGSEVTPWTKVFDNLPLTADDGTSLSYYLIEDNCPVGYEPIYGEPDSQGQRPIHATVNMSTRSVEITNRTAMTNFTLNKQWNGTQGNQWPNDSAVSEIRFSLTRTEEGSTEPDPSFHLPISFKRTVQGSNATYSGAAGEYSCDTKIIHTNTKEYYELTVKGLETYSGDMKKWVYQVTEAPTEGYKPKYTDKYYSNLSSGATNGGYIINERITAVLALEKTVTGVFVNYQKQFPFTVTLQEQDDTLLTGSYRYEKISANGSMETGSLTLQDGAASVTLSHGQKLRILGLPLHAKYTVEETLEDDSEFTVTANNVEGATALGELSNGEEDNVVSYVNRRAAAFLPTGVMLGFGGTLSLLLWASACYVLIRRRMRLRRAHNSLENG